MSMQQQPTYFCRQCQAQIPPGAIRCPNCGLAVGAPGPVYGQARGLPFGACGIAILVFIALICGLFGLCMSSIHSSSLGSSPIQTTPMAPPAPTKAQTKNHDSEVDKALKEANTDGN